MSAGFTPGPWGYEQSNGDWLITYDLAAEHGPRGLGKVFDYASEFEEANARLIAAAPSLYEVLTKIDAMWSESLEPGEGPEAARSGAVREVWQQLRDVLAKARGEPA